MSSECERIISRFPGDEIAQIHALIEAGDEYLSNYQCNSAEAVLKAAYDIAQSHTDEIPPILPKLYLAIYNNYQKSSRSLPEFYNSLKKLENGKEIIEKSEEYVLDAINDLYRKYQHRLMSDFYVTINPFPMIINKLKSDQKVDISVINFYLKLAKICKDELKSSVISEIVSTSFSQIKSQIDALSAKEIRGLDENKLMILFTTMKNLGRSSDSKLINSFLIDLSFRFIHSEYLSKQYFGLQYITKQTVFQKKFVQRIQSEEIIEYLLSNLHHDLFSPFVALLQHVWGEGAYNQATLQQVWSIAQDQHPSVIDKFFTEMPSLFSAIPKGKTNDFWNIIIQTTSFQPASLSFLLTISTKCPDQFKKQLTENFWNYASESKNKEEWVPVLSDYSDFESQRDLKKKCLSLLEKKTDVTFALMLLLNVWHNINYETTKGELNIILSLTKPDMKQISLFFKLILRITDNFSMVLDEEIVTRILNVITGSDQIDSVDLHEFFKTLMQQNKRKLLSPASLSKILEWAINLKNIDDETFCLIKSLITHINEKSSTTSILEMEGMDPLWDFFFQVELSSVAQFFVEQVTKGTSQTLVTYFIDRCLKRIESIGALRALKLLITEIEEPLDLDKLGITRNKFIDPETLVTVCLMEDFSGRLTIPDNIDVDILKKKISLKAKIDESKITIYADDSTIFSNHKFTNDEKIQVYISKKTPLSIKMWEKDELPSQILKQTNLLYLLENENPNIASAALELINYLETYPEELSIKDGNCNWCEKLDPKNYYILLYRLNIIGNIIVRDNRKFVINFMNSGGFKRIIELLLSSTKQNELLVKIAVMLISSQIEGISDLITEALTDIGIERLCESLVNSIIEVEPYKDEHLILNLLDILNAVLRIDRSVFLNQSRIKEFFEILMFSYRESVRRSFCTILSIYDAKEIENLMLDNISMSVNSKSENYFNLLYRIADVTSKPKKLWKLMAESLEKYLMVPNPNAILAKCEEEDEDENLQSLITDLCSKIACDSFVKGVINVLYNLTKRIEKYPRSKIIINLIINKIAFNGVKFLQIPHNLFPLARIILEKKPKLITTVLQRVEMIHAECEDSKLAYTNLTSKTHFKGLNNLGCTCYMNASIQQIFRIENVRNAVFSYNPSDDINNDWLAQLQLLFARMIYSPVCCINTKPFIRLWKGWDGMPIDVNEQQDAVEFVQMILDKIDETLESKPVTESVRGTILREMIGVSVDYVSESFDNFTTLCLEVKDQSNFEDSFKSFLLPDSFSGNNQINTEEKGKIDANLYHTIYKSPTILIIQLKRFDYDLSRGTRKKIHTKYEFPLEADISPLLTETRKHPELNETCLYELTGIVQHTGSADGGHYYSFIKNETTSDWFDFNDINVNPITLESALSQAFGGQSFKKNVERPDSAYLLFYKKKDRKPIDKTIEPICLMPRKMIKTYLNELQNILWKSTLSLNEYPEFIETIAMNKNRKTYPFIYNFTIKSLPNNRINNQIIRLAMNKAQDDPNFCMFIIENISRIINFLQVNPDNSARTLCVGLVNQVIFILKEESYPILENIFESDPLNYYENFDQIFKPIYYYITNVARPKEILDKCFGILEQAVHLNETFYTNVNLSALFKIILYMIENIPDAKREYQAKVLEHKFIKRWFKSTKHTFELVALISHFLVENGKLTNNYYDFLMNNNKDISVSSLAAHFASACTMKDSIYEKRVHRFLSLPGEREWNAARISCYLKETANLLSSCPEPTCDLLKYDSLTWMKSWLLHRESSVRKSFVAFIYSMFKDYHKFKQSFASLRLAKPLDKSEGSEIEQEGIKILYTNLMSLNKDMINIAKYCSDSVNPSASYFELLAFAVFYGDFKLEKETLISDLILFSSLKEDSRFSLIEILKFLSYFDPIFDEENLPNVLIHISKLPPEHLECTNVYIDQIVGLFYPMISQQLAEKCSAAIAKSHLFKLSVRKLILMSTPATKFVVDLFKLILTPDSVIFLCPILWKPEMFTKAIETKCHGFLELTNMLLKQGKPALRHFKKKKLIQQVIAALQNYLDMSYPNYFDIIDYMKIIKSFNKYEIKACHLKKKKNIFGNAHLRRFIDLWKQHTKLTTGLLTHIQKPACKFEFAKQSVKVLKSIWFADPILKALGVKVIKEEEPNEFYSKIPNEIHRQFSLLSVGVLDENVDILIRDLNRCIEIQLFEPQIFLIYGNKLIKSSPKELFDLLCRYYHGISSLKGFDSELNELSFQVAKKLSNKNIGEWLDKCKTLVVSAIETAKQESIPFCKSFSDVKNFIDLYKTYMDIDNFHIDIPKDKENKIQSQIKKILKLNNEQMNVTINYIQSIINYT